MSIENLTPSILGSSKLQKDRMLEFYATFPSCVKAWPEPAISARESDPDLIVVRQVDIRMDAEQERQNRVRQQYRNESGRSRRGFSFADED